MSDEIVRAEHVLIVGDSGSGKSTLARSVQEETECSSVVVDFSETGGYTGRRVATYDSLADRLDAGDGEIVYRSADQSPIEMCAAVVKAAKDHPEPVQIIIEEAGEVMHQGDEEKGMQQTNPVWWALHQGRDDGIKVVLVTQDPSDLPYTPVKNVPYISWVGEPAGFHSGFLSHPVGNWIPEERLPEADHRYIVMSKKGSVIYPGEGSAETPN